MWGPAASTGTATPCSGGYGLGEKQKLPPGLQERPMMLGMAWFWECSKASGSPTDSASSQVHLGAQRVNLHDI